MIIYNMFSFFPSFFIFGILGRLMYLETSASIAALSPPSPPLSLAMGLTRRQADSFKGNFGVYFTFFFLNLFIDLT